MAKDEPKKSKDQNNLVFIFSLLIGGVCGISLVTVLSSFKDKPLFESWLFLALMLIWMYASIFLQVIIHEAGHLIFGLMTGYKYLSFRVASLIWVKDNGKLRLKRLSIAGTGGQCLMTPPEAADGKPPFALYNMGGVIINIVSGLLFLGLYLLCKDIMYLSSMLLILSIIGFAFALLNGVPLKLKMLNNDGSNTLMFKKDPKSIHAFYTQLRIAEQTSLGVRLKDMPEEWFIAPAAEEMKDIMSASLGMYAYGRLMDNLLFDEAKQAMDKLLEVDALAGLHRHLLTCDKIFYELIGENRKEVLEQMLDKKQKQFMKAMKSYLTVLRTEYAYALLADKDPAKAEKILAKFNKISKTYPYPSDIESERELLDITKAKAEEKN